MTRARLAAATMSGTDDRSCVVKVSGAAISARIRRHRHRGDRYLPAWFPDSACRDYTHPAMLSRLICSRLSWHDGAEQIASGSCGTLPLSLSFSHDEISPGTMITAAHFPSWVVATELGGHAGLGLLDACPPSMGSLRAKRLHPRLVRDDAMTHFQANEAATVEKQEAHSTIRLRSGPLHQAWPSWPLSTPSLCCRKPGLVSRRTICELYQHPELESCRQRYRCFSRSRGLSFSFSLPLRCCCQGMPWPSQRSC